MSKGRSGPELDQLQVDAVTIFGRPSIILQLKGVADIVLFTPRICHQKISQLRFGIEFSSYAVQATLLSFVIRGLKLPTQFLHSGPTSSSVHLNLPSKVSPSLKQGSAVQKVSPSTFTFTTILITTIFFTTFAFDCSAVSPSTNYTSSRASLRFLFFL